MDRLAEAKENIQEADGHPASDWVRAFSLAAIAHIGIALVERMDRTAEAAEQEAEWAELAWIRREQAE